MMMKPSTISETVYGSMMLSLMMMLIMMMMLSMMMIRIFYALMFILYVFIFLPFHFHFKCQVYAALRERRVKECERENKQDIICPYSI